MLRSIAQGQRQRQRFQMSLKSVINLAKHLGQGVCLTCFSCGICFQKLKNTHCTFIISVFAWSRKPPFTRISGASVVAKTGMSALKSMSFLQKVLGADRCTVSPSRSCKNSPHEIMDGCQRK